MCVALSSPLVYCRIVKKRGKVQALTDELFSLQGLDLDSEMDVHVGIAHTRWATHGVPNAVNSHPQRSDNNNGKRMQGRQGGGEGRVTCAGMCEGEGRVTCADMCEGEGRVTCAGMCESACYSSPLLVRICVRPQRHHHKLQRHQDVSGEQRW